MVVPGVGDGTNLCDDWIPDARNLYEAVASTAVVLWKGYDNPADVLAAAAGSIECNEDLTYGRRRPDRVRRLRCRSTPSRR